MGATPDEGLLVRTTLNAVIEEWEMFVQRILGIAALPSWANMWEILHQEEIGRITKRQNNNSETIRVKKEEEDDAALASKERRQQGKKKRDLSKVRCFNCGELGHFASTCPKKKVKGASDSKVAAPKDDESEDDVAMSAHEPRKWGDMDM